MNFGFKPHSEGLLIDNLFFPASEQALAYLSSLDGKAKKDLLEREVRKIKSNQSSTQTPLLQYLAHQESPYGLMIDFVAKRFGTSKSFTDSLVHEKTDGSIANITRQNRATITVDSRSPGQKSRPIKITINRPIIDSIDDVRAMTFDGANGFEQHAGGRADPLSPGLFIDDIFLRNASYAPVFDDKQVVGHRRGTALVALAHGLKSDTVNFRADRPVEGHVFLPLDFAKRPDLALEIELMSCAPSWYTQAVAGKKSYSMFDCDNFLHGKSGFQTADFNRAIRSGKGFISTLVSERSFPSGAAYLLQSLIDHNLKGGRVFAGMPQLFEGTQNKTIAPRFVKSTAGGISPLEVYIIGDDKVPGPAILYINFESKLLNTVKGIRPLNGPLIEKLNPSLEWCEAHKYKQKLFTVTDRIGRVGVCVLYRANAETFSKAAEFAQRAESNYNRDLLVARYNQRLVDAKRSA